MKPQALTTRVVIVSWNTRDMLADCLESLFRDIDGRHDVEVVVVDNHSHDNSVEMVRERFPQVVCIVNPDNRGFAVANNQGFAESKARFGLLLNSDTHVEAGAIAAMEAALESDANISIVGARLLNLDGTLQLSCSRAPSLARDLVHLMGLDGRLPGLQYRMHQWDLLASRDVDTVMGAALMIRREVWEEVGGLDEGYFMYSEEVELCERVRKGGRRIVWLPSASVTHLGAGSSSQDKDAMFLALYKSKLRFYRRNRSALAAMGFKLILAAMALPRIAGFFAAPLIGATRRAIIVSRARRYMALLRVLPRL